MRIQTLTFLLATAISIGACATSDASTVGGISPAVRAALLKQAKRLASLEGDPHPHDIEAVRTTAHRAERLDDSESSAPPPDSPVYVVAMRGRFQCNTCSPPAGATIAPGTVITFAVRVKTLRSFEFSLGDRYPALKKLGIPVRL